MILYLRVVPGLGVAVEEGRCPELRFRPVILGGLPRGRGQVREANGAAQRAGVRPGMTLSQARHQCPDALFLQPDLPAYEMVWEEVLAALREYTPLVEPVEMGGAACDLTGCERLWGDSLTAARLILAAVRERAGISPWIGIASNRITAELASLSVGGEGIAVIQPGEERAFLADLPISVLPDIDARLALTFQVLGLRTLGDLAALPAASVKARFGARGEQLHRLASGIDRRPVTPPPLRPVVEARAELDEGTVEEAIERLQHLADHCAGELQRRRLAGTMIELRLLGADRHPAGLPSNRLPALTDGGEGGPAPGAALPLSLYKERGPGGEGASTLPVSYRIHSSRLPQPPAISPSTGQRDVGQGLSPEAPPNTVSPPNSQLPSHAGKTSVAPSDRAQALLYEKSADPVASLGHETPAAKTAHAITVVRTPINTALPLFEGARRLLLQHWQQLDEPPEVIHLIVSEFPRPHQLSFAELNRIGETGGLGGLDATRFQALAESERALSARFGDASFRHIGRVDPGNILTERRFHWKQGLPWKGP